MIAYACSPSWRRPKTRTTVSGFFDAAVSVQTVMAAAAINKECPRILYGKTVYVAVAIAKLTRLIHPTAARL